MVMRTELVLAVRERESLSTIPAHDLSPPPQLRLGRRATVGALALSGTVHRHARFHRPRRGRTDAPARGGDVVVARDPELPGGAAGGRYTFFSQFEGIFLVGCSRLRAGASLSHTRSTRTVSCLGKVLFSQQVPPQIPGRVRSQPALN